MSTPTVAPEVHGRTQLSYGSRRQSTHPLARIPEALLEEERQGHRWTVAASAVCVCGQRQRLGADHKPAAHPLARTAAALWT